MNTTGYAFSKTLHGADFDNTVQRITNALAEQGFGILTEINIQATLKKKLDVDVPKQVILGACNPPLAHKALQSEKDIGLLLPCNVVVRQDDEDIVVAIADPGAMFKVVENPALSEVAKDAAQRLKDALKTLE